MEKITVVVCYNRGEILESMLKRSLREQKDVEYELLLYNGDYRSAAETFNNAIKSANSDYILFVHQDIFFTEQDALKKIVDYLKEEHRALFGICGSKRANGKQMVFSSIFHGIWQKHVGESANRKVEVDGLDEVFLACHKDIFNEIHFDQKEFDGWHMYVADLCCQAKTKDIPIYVIPIDSVHKNHMELNGYFLKYKILPKDYFIYLKRIWKKYRNTLDYISSPCASFNTNIVSFSLYYFRLRFITVYRSFFRRLSIR